MTSNAQQWLTIKGGGGLAMQPGLTGSKAGINILGGVGYKHQISNFLMLEGDILMDMRSIEYFTGVADADGNAIYFDGGGDYLQIPITVQYKIPFKKKELVPYRMGQPKSYFFIEGGPYLAYGLSVTPFYDPVIVAAWTDSEVDPFTEDDLKPRKIDFGVTTGFGFNFNLGEGKKRLILGTRANYGMLNVYKDDRLGSASNFSAQGYLALDISLTNRKHIKHRW